MKLPKLPDGPGVYFFKKGREILYIGKATSLKDRVKSYFGKNIYDTRGPLIEKMVGEATSIKFVQTPSALEALILEAREIKRYLPIYNVKEKDNKSFNFVVITEEDFPRVLIERGRSLEFDQGKFRAIFGPFPKSSELKEALKIVRKIFPYRDRCVPLAGKPCFNAQLGLCPGVCAGWMDKTEYRKIVKHLKLFFEAKRPELIKSLEQEMKTLAKNQKFEEAEKVKRTIFALDHIQDVALIKESREQGQVNFRIEAYDIAHLSGKDTVGVMTVFEDGELNKSQYRKFKIKIDKNDDVANLKEIIRRRLGHLEWPLPNLIAVDGGVGQINAAKEILKERGFDIEIVSVLKDARHKAKEIIGAKKHIDNHGKDILLVNSEAHRFAISYHRKLRSKGFRI